MVPFKPYFLGETTPPSPRLTTCQKCFRTSDIESVGDPTHLTFFEMLGNFSIMDYFKKEAIAWAWEFVLDQMKLPRERLWVTIYVDDDEAFGYWRQHDVPAERIVRLGADNFWGPAGDSGPCGPSSEIHYDFGPGVKCNKPDCKPGCDCGRYVEFWNLVFPQYNQDKHGKRTPLPRPSIDTGMGLERMAAIMQGKRTVYDTDLFTPLLAKVGELTGKRYGADEATDNAMRIVAEHSRGIAFLIADGVLPGNDGRGYVLRRLLRRAAAFGRQLGLDEPFLTKTATLTIENMGKVYPELVQKKDVVLGIIEQEEARFSETLGTGLELIESILALSRTQQQKGQKVIPGDEAFRLYDTYGFPVELTREIARSRGFTVDQDGFDKAMAQQRERARSAHKFELADKSASAIGKALRVERTEFVGYERTTEPTKVIGILVDGELVPSVSEGTEAGLVLESTPFYGEMGGQLGDTGEITATGGRFAVTDAGRLPPEIIVHQGKVVSGILSVGDKVTATVDNERRLDIARNHTATHLLQAALRQVLGEHIQQRGSLVAPDRLRFDFSHLIPMTRDEVRRVNHLVNERIRQNLPVYHQQLPYRQAVQEGAIALFDEKYGDVVRVMRVGRPPISQELCGGTHVNATGDIGFFQITGESSIGANLRRIEAVTGRGVEAYLDKVNANIEQVAEALEADPDRLVEKAQGLAAELKNERKRTLALEREMSRQTAEGLLAKAQTIKGTTVLVARVPPTRVEVLREMTDWLREQLKSAVIVLGTAYEERPLFLAAVTPDLVAKGYNAGDIVRQVAKATGGGGGGKPTLAQAGGKDVGRIDAALVLVKDIVNR
jgi:alanyl-tRNA synthetase